MDNQEFKNKEKVALELNIAFDEATELFSEESLNTMRMGKGVGGSEPSVNSIYIGVCKEKCHCVVVNPGAACPENGIICVTASLELPTIPKPTQTKPTLA